jgi:two-component system, OmpR family, phosphate regulon sensor histidine kinase PhoR
MKSLQISRVILVAAILLIATFQFYWLNRLYRDEKEGLKKETNGIFRDVIYKMQVDRFKADTLFFKKNSSENLFIYNAVNAIKQQTSGISGSFQKGKSDSIHSWTNKTTLLSDTSTKSVGWKTRKTSLKPATIRVIEVAPHEKTNVSLESDSALIHKLAGSGMKLTVQYRKTEGDSLAWREKTEKGGRVFIQRASPGMIIQKSPDEMQVGLTENGVPGHQENAIIRMITNGKTFDDTLPVKKMDSIYRKELAKAGITIPFRIHAGKADSLHKKDTIPAAQFTTNPATVGIVHPYWYQAGFDNPVSYLLQKISLQILFSLFLVAFTSAAFIFLFRNLLAQRKLTEMKNDFISNITHELKTPLATVSVAVEALRNFGGLQHPEKTKEYLDISASELQRLNLLVDKVLKLSLFENRELELRKEKVNLAQLVEEVLKTLKLQFEAKNARVQFETRGSDFVMEADKLHMTSVLFNLLDNALKYSNENPDIRVTLIRQEQEIILEVADKGMGIPPEFRDRIFDKFFRIPSGDHHNTKGYGLGLSYVAHVVTKHAGSIHVESDPDKGSVFTVKFPVA